MKGAELASEYPQAWTCLSALVSEQRMSGGGKGGMEGKRKRGGREGMEEE